MKYFNPHTANRLGQYSKDLQVRDLPQWFKTKHAMQWFEMSWSLASIFQPADNSTSSTSVVRNFFGICITIAIAAPSFASVFLQRSTFFLHLQHSPFFVSRLCFMRLKFYAGPWQSSGLGGELQLIQHKCIKKNYTFSHYYERSFFEIVHKRCKLSLRSLRNNLFVWFERQESPQWARSHRLTAQVLLWGQPCLLLCALTSLEGWCYSCCSSISW